MIAQPHRRTIVATALRAALRPMALAMRPFGAGLAFGTGLGPGGRLGSGRLLMPHGFVARLVGRPGSAAPAAATAAF